MTAAEFLAAWEQLPRGCSYTEHDGGVGIFALPAFSEQEGLRHGFSARTGGVSEGCFSSLNLSFSRKGEARETVMRNYRIFCNAAGIDERSMVMDNYAHGTNVRRVFAADAGRGWTREPLESCDALITEDPALTLVTGHADCMALYFYDPVRRCIGLAHAGWRGALHRIGASVVEAMKASFKTDPSDLYAGVGPSICGDCFEVDYDVSGAFAAAFPGLPCIHDDSARRKAYVDLWMVAAAQLLEAGVKKERISLMNVCTAEDARLYSHRRDRGKTGGMAAFLALGGR